MGETNDLKDLVNAAIKVKAFGQEYEIRRFALGKLSRALEHIAPLGYLMRAAGADSATALVNALALGGPPAVGLISVAIEEPIEWLEDKDPAEASELVAAIIEVNAPYFFDSQNAKKFKAAFKRIEKVIETYGGATSTNSSNTDTSTETSSTSTP